MKWKALIEKIRAWFRATLRREIEHETKGGE